MFSRSGQSTLTPEVPTRKHRKGLSSSGHNLNLLNQQKYDRDALAFNHFSGFLKQPLRRHLSSDISYLVPSMPIQSTTNVNNNQTSQLVNRDVNQPPTPVSLPNRSAQSRTPEPIYSAPRRQRSFRKQRSLDAPTNDNQGVSVNSSNLGPNEGTAINPMGQLSVATSVPHLPQQPSQSPQQLSSGYPSKSVSVSTEGLIQHIISQQSQIERLSKQQDFLTQQLLISRNFDDTSSKRSGRSRARSRSTSSKSQLASDSLSSLEPVGGKQRSSSREKIQEQLHAQQARVQKHIQQLEAQLELIRDIRTGSSRPTSRSHSRATSVRDGSSCPPEEEEISQSSKNHSNRPLSADPKLFKTINPPSFQLEDESRQLKSTVDKSVLPTISMISGTDGEIINSPGQQSLNKPRLMLTNPSEESKDDELSSERSKSNQGNGKFMVNRPTLVDQDDGIPFMDDELIDDEPPDGNESDELETVFEFDRSDHSGEKKTNYGEEGEDYEDWEDEDDELDYYSRDTRSPQADTDPWSRLMEEDIHIAREEMDRQRLLMERQENDLANQRQQFVGTETNDMVCLNQRQSNSSQINQQLMTPSIENQILNNQSRYSPIQYQQMAQSPIPSTRSRSRSSSPLKRQKQQTKTISGNDNYLNQSVSNQGNVFNFNEMDTKQFQSQLTQSMARNQPSNLLQSHQQSSNQQQYRSSPIYMNQQSTTMNNQLSSPNSLTNPHQQIATSSRSSFSPVNKLWVTNEKTGSGGGVFAPPKIIDRQISTPVSNNNQIRSPNSNHIKRPSIEEQQSELYAQSSMLISKMLIPSQINLSSSQQFNQPSVPPRKKPVTPRTQSPVPVLSNVTSPSYRIQTNKNRMAGQQFISSPKRPQRSTSQIEQTNFTPNHHQQYNQTFGPTIGSSNLSPSVNQPQILIGQQLNQPSITMHPSSIFSMGDRLTPRAYSPKPITVPAPATITIARPESMFRPISSNQMKTNSTATPIIKIDPARSTSNLNLSSPSPSFNVQSRRSPSPKPQQQSSASAFLKRAGSFIQRNTSFMNKNHSKNQEKNQQSRRSPSPLLTATVPSITTKLLSPITSLAPDSQNGNNLKIDLQTIRSNRSSRASSPVPPSKDPRPTRKVFINQDTVEAGSFVDHFNHYYAPQSEPNRRPLSQQFTHSSTGEINIIGRSITPMRDLSKQSMDNQPLKRAPSTHNNSRLNNQSTANALIDAPIHYERRQTLPEITKGLGVEDTTSAKEEAVLRNLAAGKKKHSLPQNDFHEVPLIPGWEREKVATLAHEAREARMNQPSGPVVHLTAATNWLIKYKFIGLIIFFNAILLYLFMRILQPIEDQINETDDKSKST